MPGFLVSGLQVLCLATFVCYATAAGATQNKFCGLEKQDSGYIKLSNRVDTHYFYWYFESRNKPSTDPLILWIPGGPGLGGTYGLLAENGPYLVNNNLTTTLNPFSWTTQANVVWLDAPVNSGFSYSTVAEDDELTDERVAESVFYFLQGFFSKHNELQGRELFLVGESYGGHFVPLVAHYIWKKQGEHLFAPASPESIPINLQGIGIGNGLTDPVEVLTHYADMADNPYNIKLVNDTQLATMKADVPQCRRLLTRCQANTSVCGEAGAFCQRTQLAPLLTALRSPYDIRQVCATAVSNPSACIFKTPIVESYLKSPKVQKFLGVKPTTEDWRLLNISINAAFFGPPNYSGFKSMGGKVSELLEAGLRVLFYVGDADILCNFYAIEATVKKLEWSGASGFNAGQGLPYSTTSGIADAGTVSSFSHLTYVKVRNAGHMVPADQPEVALDMISKFVRNIPI